MQMLKYRPGPWKWMKTWSNAGYFMRLTFGFLSGDDPGIHWELMHLSAIQE